MAADLLYERVAKQLAEQIDQSIFQPGDRLPCVRLQVSKCVSSAPILSCSRFCEWLTQTAQAHSDCGPRDCASVIQLADIHCPSVPM